MTKTHTKQPRAEKPPVEMPESGKAAGAMSQQGDGGTESSPDRRERMIAEAAYYIAEQRGFDGGDPQQNWLMAEQEIDRQMQSAAHDSVH